MQRTGVCGVWKSSFHASSSSREARAIPPPEWLDRVWDGKLTAEANLGMVLASGDAAAPQYHLEGIQGVWLLCSETSKVYWEDEPCECPSLFPGPVSGSGITSCFWTSSWAGMLSSICFTWN